MNFILIFIILIPTGFALANNDGPSCTKFSGEGAKKTFLELYPFTQGRATAISAIKKGDKIEIKTRDIICQVKTGEDIPNRKRTTMSEVKTLKTISSNDFECGYLIYSEGVLEACKTL